MIDEFAMGDIGKTKPKHILEEADERSRNLIETHKAFIESVLDRLIKEKEISGEEMRKAFEEYGADR